jgi:O-antigen/teichoic acid export membrane protein
MSRASPVLREQTMAVETEKNEAIRRQVALSTAANYGGRVVTLAVWFVLTPIILSHIGKTDFGLWALVASFVAYGSLADLGIASAITKYVAELRARRDSETASQLIATALWLYCGLGLALIGVAAALAPIVPHVIKGVPAKEHTTVSWLLVITAAGVAVQLPSNCGLAVLRGLNRFDKLNIVGSLAMVTLGASIIVILSLGGGVLAITAVVIPLTLIWLVPTIWFIHRCAPDLRFGFRGARLSHARRVLLFSSALFGIQVAQAVKLQSDEIVIGASLPVADVSPYSIARRLSTLPGQLTDQFVFVLLPLASRLHAEGDSSLLNEVYVSGMRLTLALFSIVGGWLIIFARPFLLAYTPKAASSADIIVLLTVAALLEALMSPVSQALQGMSRHRPLVVFALCSAALNLTLSITLVGPLGVRGVAIGTLVATALEAAVALPYGARVIGVRAADVARRVVLPGAIPLIPMVAVLAAIHVELRPATIPTLVLSGLAGAVTYLAVYLVLPGTESERALARGLLARV